jgi:hypothetical protein
MKEIQPIIIWYQGQSKTANIFNFYSINDNLNDSATFYYALFTGTIDELGIKLTEGNITMTGNDYTTYSTSSDSNIYAYNWGANKLGLTLL